MNKSSAKQEASQSQLVSFFVAILVIAGVTGSVWMWMQKQTPVVEEIATVTEEAVPTPTLKPKPIPSGKIPFTVTTTWPGPKFSSGFFDPYDPAMGKKMTIAISMTDTKPVQRVWATVTSDTKTSAKIPFTRTSGTDLSGEWQGAWTVDDTYLYTYMVTIEADSENGHTKTDVSMR